MTYSKKWTKAKALKWCEDNFVGDEDDFPERLAAFIEGCAGSVELNGASGTKEEKLVITVDPYGEY